MWLSRFSARLFGENTPARTTNKRVYTVGVAGLAVNQLLRLGEFDSLSTHLNIKIMSNIQPTNNYVLVKPIIIEETKSGLIMAEKKREQEGEVVATGPKVTGVAVGDKVFYTKYVENVYVRDGIAYIVLPEDQIMLVIK